MTWSKDGRTEEGRHFVLVLGGLMLVGLFCSVVSRVKAVCAQPAFYEQGVLVKITSASVSLCKGASLYCSVRVPSLNQWFASYAICLRPYHVENTSSRLITEVKQRRARLVLGWVTAWESRVL